MRNLAAAAALLLASCYDPGGQCAVDTDCLADQVCGADGLCVPGTRPPTGDPPVAAADAYPFLGRGPFDVSRAAGVLANDTDPGGAALAAELVANATYGRVYLAPDGSFTYVPITNYNGADAFTYRASNGTYASDVATVAITVAGPPLSGVDAYDFSGAGPFAVAAAGGVLANDSDQNGAALTAELVSNATYGDVALAADGSFTYTPGPGFTGADGFTYRATNGTVASDPTSVTIRVAAPVAGADTYAFAGAGPFGVGAAGGVLANDSDPGGATLTATLVASPANGALALAADGSFTYTPNAGFTGVDGFTYRATNGTLASAVTGVSITVGP